MDTPLQLSLFPSFFFPASLPVLAPGRHPGAGNSPQTSQTSATAEFAVPVRQLTPAGRPSLQTSHRTRRWRRQSVSYLTRRVLHARHHRLDAVDRYAAQGIRCRSRRARGDGRSADTRPVPSWCDLGYRRFWQPLVQQIRASSGSHELALLGDHFLGNAVGAKQFAQGLIRGFMDAGSAGVTPEVLAHATPIACTDQVRLLAKHRIRVLRGPHSETTRKVCAAYPQKLRFGVSRLPVSLALTNSRGWSIRRPVAKALRAIRCIHQIGRPLHLALDLRSANPHQIAADLRQLLEEHRERHNSDASVSLCLGAAVAANEAAAGRSRSILRAA